MRKRWDSNPRISCPIISFQDWPIQPLWYPSIYCVAGEIRTRTSIAEYKILSLECLPFHHHDNLSDRSDSNWRYWSHNPTYYHYTTTTADSGNFEIPTSCLTGKRSTSELRIQKNNDDSLHLNANDHRILFSIYDIYYNLNLLATNSMPIMLAAYSI